MPWAYFDNWGDLRFGHNSWQSAFYLCGATAAAATGPTAERAAGR
jgi:hypothetical protein